jgi:predicted RND superfamily exporter protein
VGILKLKSVGFIVDDLPKTDKVYLDLKFFEKNFKGIMPLEIMVDTKKRRGVKRKGLSIFNRIDSLSMYIASQKEMNRPLNVSEGLKFATQAFYDNDSMSYRMPSNEEGAIINDLIVASKGEGNGGTNMLNAFIDSSSRYTRISVNMADIGTERLPKVLADIQEKANQYFDTSYQVTLTGTSITFLEGSKFIINGLKESIFWAFLLIALCMLYLFRSFKMLIVSLLPNIIPLMVTAGVMGWVGVPLKPSTVLVFSVALGIAVDITIRFLVNYRQILPMYNNDVEITVKQTVKQTGLSIIYTSLVLMAGFIIFCGSSFGGTFALGWLTSITLLVATITNLIFLPVLLVLFNKKSNTK